MPQIPPAVLDALNVQAEHERLAAASYLAMSHWCLAADFPGFAEFFKNQCDEETAHTAKIHAHLLDRGATPVLKDLPAPRQDFPGLDALARHAADLEQANTAGIHGCYETALAANDYPSQVLLHWFINEQVEEEAWTARLLTLVQRATCAGALAQLDRHIVRDLAGDE